MAAEASRIILEIVCPTLGAVVANLMFSAPVRAVRDAVERGYLGDLNPTPWAFMTGNCVGWVAYSFQLRNFYIFIANCPGFVASVWFNLCAAKLQSQEHTSQEMRQSVVSFLEEARRKSSVTIVENTKRGDSGRQDEEEGEDDLASSFLRTASAAISAPDGQQSSDSVDLVQLVWQVTAQAKPAPAPHERIVMIIVFIWTTLLSVVALARISAETGQMVVGVAVNLNLLFFYGAPLSTIYAVLSTRNSASIHIWTMVTNTLNATFWTAYGIAVVDYFVAVPNGIGVALGVVQFLLLLIFPRKEFTRGVEETTDDEKGGTTVAVVEACETVPHEK